jgi:hypothetical protein
LQIRSWEFPRSERALEALKSEFGAVDFPSNYILFEGRSKVYIGEAKSIYKRLKAHIAAPEDKIKNWDRALIINDGRPARQSDFNDSVVRKALELHLIKLFKANKYKVVSQGEPQMLNSSQKLSFDALKEETNFFLQRKNLIAKLLEEPWQEEVFGDELRKVIQDSGMEIQKWAKYEAVLDNEKVFIRPGSKKPRGWQITFRGRKPGSFIEALQKGKGYLLIPRNGVLLIPLAEVQKVIKEKAAYGQDTIDIWLVFTEEKVTLSYKRNAIDVTEFGMIR